MSKMKKLIDLETVQALNRVDGFDPSTCLEQYWDENNLPVMRLITARLALWFRLKYPNGKIQSIAKQLVGEVAVFEARIYLDYQDASEHFLQSATGSKTRGESPNDYIEWAETAAIGRALRYAGFGVQLCDQYHQQSVGNTDIESQYNLSDAIDEGEIPDDFSTTPYEDAATAAQMSYEGESPIDNEIETYEEHGQETISGKTQEQMQTEKLQGAEMEPQNLLSENQTLQQTQKASTADKPVDAMTVEECLDLRIPDRAGQVGGKTLREIIEGNPNLLNFMATRYTGADSQRIRAAASKIKAELMKQ